MYKPTDHFTLEDTKFVKLFRLSKVLVRNLIELLTDYLKHPTRASAISIELKVILYMTVKFEERPMKLYCANVTNQ
nr:unnamed protein product [Callosobruchus analis]